MFSLKNSKLKKRLHLKLCKIHNDKKHAKSVIKMFTRKSSASIKVFYFLKNKKPKKQISGKHTANFKTKTRSKILSKRYSSILLKEFKPEWVSENELVDWLQRTGVNIQKISSKNYSVDGRSCSPSQLLIFANKKRANLGLNPFCIQGLTEDS